MKPLTSIYHLKRRDHHSLKERLVIKSFKSTDAMHRYVQDRPPGSPSWQYVHDRPTLSGQDISGLKAGTYAFAGGRWHNVKSLDPTVLAHI